LLCYALPVGAGMPAQQQAMALISPRRVFPIANRGTAQTIGALGGKWAVPGDNYGNAITTIANTLIGAT
jgi:hypothetical protein